jgi:hypothetical protein
MTFDSRAHQAVQGIHHAVDVMEMSSTKTTQTITRFDEYRKRKSRNRRIAAIAVGIAVPLMLLFGAVRLLGPDDPSHVPAMTPSESASPPPVSGRSHGFEAPFTYALPLGWKVTGTGVRYFSLGSPKAGPHVFGLSSVVPARSDCTDRPKQGVGTSSDAMTSWLSAHPALDATTPRSVTLGAATGSYVDIQLAANWNQTCPNGLTLVTGQPFARQTWSINGDQEMRLYVLDLPAGDTVTIVIEATHSSEFQDVIDQAAPVVESFRFHQ